MYPVQGYTDVTARRRIEELEKEIRRIKAENPYRKPTIGQLLTSLEKEPPELMYKRLSNEITEKDFRKTFEYFNVRTDISILKRAAHLLQEDSSTKDKLIKNILNQLEIIQSQTYQQSLTIKALADLLPLILNRSQNQTIKMNKTTDNSNISNQLVEKKLEQITTDVQKVVETQEKLVKFSKSVNKLLDDAKDGVTL
jgi:hypothetical protein